jgi:hypothetical protein
MALLDNENVALNYKGILNFGATINENINTTPKQITDGDNIGSNIWIDTLHTFLGVAITTPVASAFAVRGNALENIASFRDDADAEVAFITSLGVLASTGLLITPAGEVAFSTVGKISATTPELEVPDLIQIGGTSNTSPALKKNSADLQVRLADDTAFANFIAKKITSTAADSPGIGGFNCSNSVNTDIFVLVRNNQAGLVIQSLTNIAFSVNSAYSTSTYELQIATNGLLVWGTDNSATPGIKKDTIATAVLQARLGDDSGFATFQGILKTDTSFTAAVVVPTGYLQITDSTGTVYKIPAEPL